MDLVQIYTYFSSDDDDDDVSKHLDTMVEERGNLPDTKNLHSNLIEVHSKMMYLVKDKLTNVLEPMLQIPEPTKYYYWFALELTDIKTFHQSKNIDTTVLVHKMFHKFYE